MSSQIPDNGMPQEDSLEGILAHLKEATAKITASTIVHETKEWILGALERARVQVAAQLADSEGTTSAIASDPS